MNESQSDTSISGEQDLNQGVIQKAKKHRKEKKKQNKQNKNGVEGDTVANYVQKEKVHLFKRFLWPYLGKNINLINKK